MDAVERLPFDTVLGNSLSASEHVQRYRWAAAACRGLRVLDLCCGVGYGSLILAEEATSVVGVDIAEEAIREARAAAVPEGADVTFEMGDALRWLDQDLAERFDAIVCFEGLEHLPDFGAAVERLARHARSGLRLLLSVPNSRTFEEDNEFHVTNLDHEGAEAAFAAIGDGRMLFQYVAEGAMILDRDGTPDGTVALTLPDRTEPEYANTFLYAVNVPDDVLAATAHLRGMAAPYQTRELVNLARANAELWATNRQLGRQLADVARELERGGAPLAGVRSFDTAAGSVIGKLVTRAEVAEKKMAAMEEQLRAAQADAGNAWYRYNLLRQRKVVRLALAAARVLKP